MFLSLFATIHALSNANIANSPPTNSLSFASFCFISRVSCLPCTLHACIWSEVSPTVFRTSVWLLIEFRMAVALSFSWDTVC